MAPFAVISRCNLTNQSRSGLIEQPFSARSASSVISALNMR